MVREGTQETSAQNGHFGTVGLPQPNIGEPGAGDLTLTFLGEAGVVGRAAMVGEISPGLGSGDERRCQSALALVLFSVRSMNNGEVLTVCTCSASSYRGGRRCDSSGVADWETRKRRINEVVDTRGHQLFESNLCTGQLKPIQGIFRERGHQNLAAYMKEKAFKCLVDGLSAL